MKEACVGVVVVGLVVIGIPFLVVFVGRVGD